MNGYRIAEVAQRTGFRPATLRYYEDIGVLPPPARTEAGYRVYDDAVFERLALVGRAKQLGLTLEEIARLGEVWEGDECAPVQERLRQLVDEKLAEANGRIADLVELSSQLQAAAAALRSHTPDGPCDDSCGCAAERQAADPPIACTLAPDAVGPRVADWNALVRQAIAHEPIDGGTRVRFGPDVDAADVARLAAAEQQCCQFFSFAVILDGAGVALEVRAPDDAQPVIAALFGD